MLGGAPSVQEVTVRIEGRLAQGKKGTGAGKKYVGFRCPPDVYSWLAAALGPDESDTARLIEVLRDAMALEVEAGERMPELRAAAVLEVEPLGKTLARLALEALDARKKSKR